MTDRPDVLKLRSVFVSDVHMGNRWSKAGELASFLDQVEVDYLYLVGDIFDGWKLGLSWLWPESHFRLVDSVLAHIAAGTEVVYLPGNHDEFLKRFCGLTFAGVEVATEVVHTTADGCRVLITHGDRFDALQQRSAWLPKLGARVHGTGVLIGSLISHCRRVLGLDHWSFTAYVDGLVERATNSMSSFEEAAVSAAVSAEASAVICGHTHRPAAHVIGDVLYLNTGDWVENMTAVVEHEDGTLQHACLEQ